MRNKRAKWIKKVVISKPPELTELLNGRFGEEVASKMTNHHVIRFVKKMWTRHMPEIRELYIHKQILKRGEA